MRTLHWGRGLQIEWGHWNPPGGHGQGSTGGTPGVSLFYPRVLLGHALFNTHTHTGCYTSTRLLHIYYLKILSHDETDIAFYHFASFLGRHGKVFSIKGANTPHNMCRGKKKNLIFYYCPPALLEHSSLTTPRGHKHTWSSTHNLSIIHLFLNNSCDSKAKCEQRAAHLSFWLGSSWIHFTGLSST